MLPVDWNCPAQLARIHRRRRASGTRPDVHPRIARARRARFKAGLGSPMNTEAVEKIADAILYEGYLLYPYRRSAIKNRRRWDFGIVYPPGRESENEPSMV